MAMEEAHRPLTYSPVAASLVTQPALHPARPWSQHQSNLAPLSMPLLNNQPQSIEQPSTMIYGFTLTELAHVAIQVAGITIAAVFGAWAVKAYESANIANRLSEDSLSQSNIANSLAQDALKQSFYANILSIINLCLSDQFRGSADCPAVLQESRFSSIIRGVIPTFSPLSTSTTLTIPTSALPSSSSTLPSSSSTLPATTTSTRPTSALPSSSSATTTRSTLLPTITSTAAVSDSRSGSRLAFGALIGIIVAVVAALAVICLILIWYRRGRRSRMLGVGAPDK